MCLCAVLCVPRVNSVDESICVAHLFEEKKHDQWNYEGERKYNERTSIDAADFNSSNNKKHNLWSDANALT